MTALISPELVVLDADLGSDKAAVVHRLAGLVADAGRATGAEALAGDALAREAQAATGLPGGIAIPHCRSGAVTQASLAFARLRPGVDFGAADGPADLVFLIAAPAAGDADHLTLLSALARALVRPDFVASLRAAASAQDVVALVEEVVSPKPATGASAAASVPAPATPAPAADAAPARRRLVAVSACPTGIAHTYMAADKLTAAAEAEGVDLVVETQGSSGSTPLDPAVIRDAEAVVFAVDVGVKDQERFAGKPVVQSGTKRAINEPEVMIREALAAADDPNSRRVPGSGAAATAPTGGGGKPSTGAEIRRWLLTGVSYMIPFVAAGGLLIALGFLLAGYPVALTDPDSGNSWAKEWVLNNSLFDLPVSTVADLNGGLSGYLGAMLFFIGSLAFSLFIPAMAGYIAYAIADRPGLAPGFITGLVAVQVNAGFLGALVGGVIAGFAARWLSRLKVGRVVRGLMPVVVIPLIATLIASGLMVLVLGRPLAAAITGLTNWLNGLSGTSAVLLGILLGLMMAFDMGGPVNKAAYAFATAGLASYISNPTENTGPLVIMATVMGAGMVPPIALTLATLIRPKVFTPAEQEQGKAAWLLGLAFITEGAIPFAAADPLRVIPPIMIGSATTGAIVAAAGVQAQAPHGGIVVFFAINGVLMWLLAIAVGTVVGAVAVVIAKSIGRKKIDEVPEDAVDLAHAHNPAPAVSAPARV
ncbi:fructose-specific PTS transporter subunit EIIC [Geodermatophilus aquaeductus]|uniref:PTS system D-fructose-specific IIA component (F1P-forming), Frc family /PTS system D-fructose-specific IIB component (F1P-forming), Frc family /PTS system D-fructose-specific IIC component (F1P-for... n=1 Tax=Geodermatophilus aquaeductus TaxID=1564161 RepID=A0A521B326_9ACTN|nr:fructose-specific PTS transporter subunit EIIC [Geodermatophilus aquaeductus]SMO41435.1 PTS system D-fructose-specific IIA component (F1P-forming), Frc family /PTS system D-fructose-specific IIB component (F1P-forming), Frc family /PTS system D-fructose-specific IIC component (F1P-forming), Frc family [Geodermatophilus aquaeductus]